MPPFATGSVPDTCEASARLPPKLDSVKLASTTSNVASPPITVPAPPDTEILLDPATISSSDVCAVPPFAIGSVPDTSAVRLTSPTDHVPPSTRTAPVELEESIPVPP